MEHIKIEQNTSLIEEVDKNIISKLYEIASNNELDASSNLKGRLHSSVGYSNQIEYLTQRFNELYINADKSLLFFREQWIAEKLIAGLANYTNKYAWAQQIVSDEGFTAETAAAFESTFDNIFGRSLTSDEWGSIKYFNELAYFTKVNYLNGCFFRDIIEIDISNIKRLTTYDGNFNNCTNLTTIRYNSQTLELEGAFFQGCSSLKVDINVPNNTYDCSAGFGGSGIERILNPGPGLKLYSQSPYGWGCFRNCASLKYISIPYNVASEQNLLGGGTDNGNFFRDCGALECVIFNCQSVFTLGTSNHFTGTTANSNYKIYVPDSLVSAYKADTYWSAFSSRIFGISQLQTDNTEYYQLWQDYTDHSAEPSS